MEPNTVQAPPQPLQPDLTCESCHVVSPATFFFCPNCGHNLRPKPLSTTILKQTGLYLLAFLLPPLGLWPGIRYLKGKTDAEKIVGAVLVILTVVSIILTLWFFLGAINSFKAALGTQQIPPSLLQ